MIGTCANCGETAELRDSCGELHCQPCYVAGLEHGHRHGIHDDHEWDDEDREALAECPLCAEACRQYDARKANRRTPAEWASMVLIAIARAKLEIRADEMSGRLPTGIRDFSRLHDFIDANEYGGLCEPGWLEYDDQGGWTPGTRGRGERGAGRDP